jgi:sterol desaturase/sphingolipid hydroxylase (fatty acid hydroxylase superfamily)
MSNDNNQAPSASRHFASLLLIPVFFIAFYALRALAGRSAIEQWLPEWDTFATLGAMMVLERLYTYRHAVSQRSVLARDITSTLVNVYLAYGATAFILLPGLLWLTNALFGRPLVVASPEQLGPVWLQIPAIWLVVSFFRYWMHRWQHSNEFLWKLHSYHHRVTDLKATNTFVSHPIDYALRNAVVFVLLGLVGFAPLAMVIALPALAIPGIFSHCGGDVKGGALNRWFVTPEVHRWHHSAVVPEGHRYSVNYSVELSFWDRLFGTFYLPVKDGQAEQPERVGHPDGLADERNYLKLVLAPLGLWPSARWLERFARRQRAG